jgi:hypothetical protein
MNYSVALIVDFLYGERRHEHLFWSFSDMENYFRWEPGRGVRVGFGTNGATGKEDKTVQLKLIILDAEQTRIKEKVFDTYGELVDFVNEHSIKIGNTTTKRKKT